MLVEIQCDEFKDQGKPRGAISLRRGLNVVLGSASAANSIGKTTFLLIIDFAFGGDTYAKNFGDMEMTVGHHDILFTFEFDGVLYRFRRNTQKYQSVWFCDDDYRPQSEKSMTDFRKWLLSRYHMDELGASFRNMVSCFFRIYGKGNCDETHPLKMVPEEGERAGLQRLLSLFGFNESLQSLKSDAAEAKERKEVFANAEKCNFIRSAPSKTAYRNNSESIVELEHELDLVIAQSNSGIATFDSVTATQIASAKDELANLNRQRSQLRTVLSTIKDDESIEGYKPSKELGRLLEFFPGANLRRLEEIEAFHQSLKRILTKERKEASSVVSSELEATEEQISKLEADLSTLNLPSTVSEAVLRRYSELKTEIETLEEANRRFDEKASLEADWKEKEAACKIGEKSCLDTIQSEINPILSELNAEVCGPETTAPELVIRSSSSYRFFIPNDTGTGSLTRGTFLLDYALLELTPLPAIAHDTVMTKQVQDSVMEKLLELYTESSKQVFVAIDKAESFRDGMLPPVISDATVIHLEEGHELFGWSWSRSHPDTSPSPTNQSEAIPLE